MFDYKAFVDLVDFKSQYSDIDNNVACCVSVEALNEMN